MADTAQSTDLWSFIHRLPAGDKLGHFLLFGMFSFLLNITVPSFDRLQGKHLQVTAVLALLVLLEELSQRWLANRNFDYRDLLADFAGIAFFAWLACRCLSWRAKSHVCVSGKEG